MAKGRRAKGDEREVKDSSITTRITASQKKKLDWLAGAFKRSVADLIGEWIENVFAGMGGDLNAKPEPMPKQSEPSYTSFHLLVMGNFQRLNESGKFSSGRLQELMSGREPTDLEIVRIALICGVSEELVRSLPKNGEKNADIRVE